jgi:hypothetical protein
MNSGVYFFVDSMSELHRYVNAAVSALVSEHPAVDGAFFDDFDGSVCPFESAYDSLPERYVLFFFLVFFSIYNYVNLFSPF